MQHLSDLAVFAPASLALAALVIVLRLLVLKAATTGRHSPSSQYQHLRPAELAYLFKDGDMSNVAIVLAFDLLHRAAKAGSESEYPTDLASYETNLWQKARDTVKGWSDDQVGKVLPAPGKESLSVTTKKVSAIYRFFSKNLRAFVGEVVSDPKKIKRYISFAGAARFVADLGMAGYLQTISEELSADLVGRGLLVPLEKSKRFCLLTGMLAVLLLGAVIAIVLPLFPDVRMAISCLLLAAVNAAAVRFYLFFLELLPLYSELKDVLAHMDRGSWRLNLIRFLTRLFSVLTWSVLSMAILILLIVECLALKYALAASLLHAAAVIILVSANIYLVIQLIHDTDRLSRRYQLSAGASALVNAERKKLSQISPMETFGQLLTASQYNPEFSRLVALYGVETLWLLA